MSAKMDGKYYTKGRSVWKAPLSTPKAEGGSTISMGFKICQLDDYAPDEAAQVIADAMNQSAENHRGCFCPHCNP